MNERMFRLNLSTRVLAGTEEAIHLLEQKERLELAVQEKDAPLSIDLSKAFLEAIFKTILNDRVKDPRLEQDFPQLFRSIKDVLPFSQNQDISKKISNLAGTIVHIIPELRNSYGAASHGKDGYHQNPLNISEVEFFVSAVDGLAAFLYKKHKDSIDVSSSQRIHYDDHSEFNEWLDEQSNYELTLSTDFKISLKISQALFDQDPEAYREMLIQYSAPEDEEDELNEC